VEPTTVEAGNSKPHNRSPPLFDLA